MHFYLSAFLLEGIFLRILYFVRALLLNEFSCVVQLIYLCLEVTSVLENEEDRGKLFEALRAYHELVPLLISPIELNELILCIIYGWKHFCLLLKRFAVSVVLGKQWTLCVLHVSGSVFG